MRRNLDCLLVLVHSTNVSSWRNWYKYHAYLHFQLLYSSSAKFHKCQLIKYILFNIHSHCRQTGSLKKMKKTITVLFWSLNSPGHVNSATGIADKLKEHYQVRNVFLVGGPTMGTTIQDHGHELRIYEEKVVFEDYEIDEDEANNGLEVDEEEMKRKGKIKKQFKGAFKFPQIMSRNEHLFRMNTPDAGAKRSEILVNYMLREVIDNHDTIKEAIEDVNPDLVIVDSFYVPPCIVNLKHIPWVKLVSANPMMILESKLPNGVKPPPFIGAKLGTKQDRERMRKDEPEKWQALLDEWLATGTKMSVCQGNGPEILNRFLKEHDCELLPPDKLSHDSPHLNLYLYPKALDYDQDDDLFCYGKRWLGCDSLVRQTKDPKANVSVKEWDQKVNEAMIGKKELVFVSLGSIASGNTKLITRLLNLLKDDHDRLYVISKGVNGHKFELPNPKNMIGGNYIPQTYLLERADLAIIHGGNNSTSECLFYGCPTIVLPCFGDQIDNAQRFEDLGLGKKIDPYECTKEELNHAINSILSDKALVEKVRDIGRQMRARDDSRKISAILKKLADEKKLDQEFIEECRHKNYEEIKF